LHRSFTILLLFCELVIEMSDSKSHKPTIPSGRFTIRNRKYNPTNVGVPKSSHNYGPSPFRPKYLRKRMLHEMLGRIGKSEAFQRAEIYGDPYSDYMPGNSESDNSESDNTENNTENNSNEIHPFLTTPLDKLKRTISLSNAANEIIYIEQHGDKLNKKMENLLRDNNPGFRVDMQGPNPEDTTSYKIIEGNDGIKRWEPKWEPAKDKTGGKRRTRSSCKKRSKRTVRKQRK